MIKCVNCGCELQDGMKFCVKCGASQEGQSAESKVEVQPEVQKSEGSAEKQTAVPVVENVDKVKKICILAWVLFGISLIAVIVLGVRYKQLLNRADYWASSYWTESNKRNQLLNSPLHVYVTKVYNEADNSTILDHNKITYLDFSYEVLKVDSFVDGLTSIGVKIYSPGNILMKGDSSPEGLTFYLSPSSNWSGWGAGTPGTYVAGNYTIEFWYSGNCVGRKVVTIK